MSGLRNPGKIYRGLNLLLLLATPLLIFAQSVGAPPLTFEVSSIKPNKTGSRSSRSGTLPGGRGFSATNVTVRQLILTAYRLRGLQLVGGPSWIDSERFDVDARAPENSTQEQSLAMLRTLLAERFKLIVHNETKDQPIYALVTARSDKTLGPKIKPTTLDCSIPRPPSTSSTATAPVAAAGCGMSTNQNNNSGVMTGGSRPLSDLAAALVNFVADRMVVDRTGITGMFDFELRWTQQNLQSPADPGGTATQDAPSIFTALQEQLGLKLESQRGPVEFLVMDSVEPPTAN